MKKILLFFIIIIIGLLASCKIIKAQTLGEQKNMNEINYDIVELNDFFKEKVSNETIVSENHKNLQYVEVNEKFPVENVKKGGYSVYSVKQGGYYYIFWSERNLTINNIEEKKPFVYFVTYLSESRNKNYFKSLKMGVSTAEDVKLLDEFFELNFAISNGVFSYSYIDNKYVVEIEYTHKDNIKKYSDLIIKDINLISRKESASCYSLILPEDIPKT